MSGRDLPRYRLSPHARDRVDQRTVTVEGIEAALRWGRRTRSHHDHVYRLDRRSVARAREHGVRVEAHAGTHVVLTPDHTVRSVWCNHNPPRLRAWTRRRRSRR